MKKTILVLAVLCLIGTACSAARVNPMGPGGGGAMQPMTELVVGTLKLEGTADAVTREQAADLLPLWEVYKDISGSDTAAKAEVEGLTEQIQQSMTEAQRKSISAMKLTQEDVMQVMREQAPFTSDAGASRSTSGNNGFQGGGGFAGGGMPPGAGGPPAGGMVPGGDFGGGVQTTGTPRANGENARAGGQTGVPAVLINALIEYLTEKAAS